MKQTDLTNAYGLVHLPAKVALAVTEKPGGGYNLITLEWFMRTSIQPPMFAISIGHSRFSHECLLENRFFNLVFPSVEMKPLCAMAGSTSGRDNDKFAQGAVETMPGKLRKLPVLKDAVAVFECEVTSQVRSGDHTIFVGEVRHCWANAGKELLVYS
ncbi:MAG: flavin reductase family protein [Candidatus Cloacimonetes bacterium]|jgi:flavin reductase (DIM6/NTAB) family NADH-FMN oxidoreductase RutF|nr:flavin reductase family protein [Candidatus Cloacimonadota bacterium]MDD3143267.1 flavin reductase family protein [Candidatus Cloacimonadota bacterium]MDY0367600.1 flavin reductase family protein [Candidatus Syntrophosphaera sp.]HOY85275.1 flavin reductase family protein [Candidatus Syntrophosphaera sp.]HPH60767.1 flavin reductase family protein [Candidatus Syntrophosphaera sp.]